MELQKYWLVHECISGLCMCKGTFNFEHWDTMFWLLLMMPWESCDIPLRWVQRKIPHTWIALRMSCAASWSSSKIQEFISLVLVISLKSTSSKLLPHKWWAWWILTQQNAVRKREEKAVVFSSYQLCFLVVSLGGTFWWLQAEIS